MKKVLFLRMMAVAIIITLLAGCGAANAAPAKTETATEATTAQAETATEATTAQAETATEATTAQTETATEATTAQAETATEATTAQADTAETAPNQTTVVVWLDKGDVIVIEEYGDHYTVTNSDGSSEYPISLPHIEESKCEYSELPGEWQEALTR